MAHAVIPYTLVRSDRKTLSLEITREGQLKVRAPKRMSRAQIDGFVQSKEAWIVSHMETVQNRLTQRQPFSLRPGEQLRFCGTMLTICPSGSRCMSLSPTERRLYVPEMSGEALREGLEKLAKRAGLPWIRSRLDFWAKKMGIPYTGVNISCAQRRWGSCSAGGKIHISWLLLFADPEDVDYVLVHELAHRVEFNHSAAFWAIVGQYMPDYKVRKENLTAFSKQLYARGWTGGSK